MKSTFTKPETTGPLWPPTQISAFKKFSGFKPEPERSSHEAEVSEASGLKRILEAWYSIEERGIKDAWGRLGGQEELTNRIYHALGGIRATNAEVNEFIRCLISTECPNQAKPYDPVYPSNFQAKVGNFLSALINSGADHDYEIWVSGLPPPEFLGYANSKNIVVHGGAGDNAFHENTGNVEIIGDAGLGLAIRQAGGKIVLWGDCGSLCCSKKKDGEIVIHGNAGSLFADELAGGISIVKGDIEVPFANEMAGGLLIIEGKPVDSPFGDLQGDIIGLKKGIVVLKGGIDKRYHTLSASIRGGEIHVFGKMPIIDVEQSEAKIFHNGKRVL